MTAARVSTSRKIVAVGVVALLGIVMGWLVLAELLPKPHTPEGPGGEPPDITAAPRPIPPDDSYVGTAVCAECHDEESREYAAHPMGQSAASVADASPIEAYGTGTTFTPPGNRTYFVEKKEDKTVWHHEVMSDLAGETLYDQAVQVHFAVGSGKRGRTYLIDRGGILHASSVSWYTGAGKFDLSPGYRPQNHLRFERRIGDGCLFCHVGRVNFKREAENVYNQPVFLEAAIGCERCHGPGEDHVRRQRESANDPAGERGTDSIVNPARLEPRRRDAVCEQCHLQSEATIPRYGRSLFDFRPGGFLEDVRVDLVSGTRIDAMGATKAVSHVPQMRASKCFQKSQGRFGCISCHDPHSTPPPEEADAFYRGKCTACHTPGEKPECGLPIDEQNKAPASGSCVACHMPKLPASDVPHTSQTDHRVLKMAFSTLEADPPVSPADLVFFAEQDKRIPNWEAQRARAMPFVTFGSRSDDAALVAEGNRLLQDVLPHVPDDPLVLEFLGTASLYTGHADQAQLNWEHSAGLAPDREAPFERMLMFLQDQDEDNLALACVDRLLALNPWTARFHGRRAHILGKLGRLDEAIRSAERGLELDPTMQTLREWLVGAYKMQNRLQESDAQMDLYRRMEAATATPTETHGEALSPVRNPGQ